MKKNLRDMRPVYVVGIGLHRYQRLSETPYVTLGLTAVREALADAAVEWRSVESAYTGTEAHRDGGIASHVAASRCDWNSDGAG